MSIYKGVTFTSVILIVSALFYIGTSENTGARAKDKEAGRPNPGEYVSDRMDITVKSAASAEAAYTVYISKNGKTRKLPAWYTSDSQTLDVYYSREDIYMICQFFTEGAGATCVPLTNDKGVFFLRRQ